MEFLIKIYIIHIDNTRNACVVETPKKLLFKKTVSLFSAFAMTPVLRIIIQLVTRINVFRILILAYQLSTTRNALAVRASGSGHP